MACVLVFSFSLVSFSLDPSGKMPDETQAGILWVAIAFSGSLALGRAFERERQAETLRALLLAPVERASVYLGKLFSLLVLMAAVEMVLVPVVGLLFGAHVGRAPWLLLGLLGGGHAGICRRRHAACRDARARALARRAAADPAVSDHRARDSRRRAGHGGDLCRRAGRHRQRAELAGDAGIL